MHSRWLDGVTLRNADELLVVLAEHRNVRAVLWGHVHQTSDRRRNGVRFLSTPSTCFQFLPRSDDFRLDDKPPGFRVLDLHASGMIRTCVNWLDG